MLNIGIIGFGYMGEIRARVLRRRPDCLIKSIYHTEAIKGNFDFEASWEKIVSDPTIDIIFVCVPNYMTCEIVTAGLGNGKHVFAEKPPGGKVMSRR